MDWKTEAIKELRHYSAAQQAVSLIPQQIAEIDSNMRGVRSISADISPVRKGISNGVEDMLVCQITKKDELHLDLQQAQLSISIVSKGLGILDSEELHIIDALFIHPQKGNIDRLCEELYIERSQVYVRRSRSLAKFTAALYGVVDD